MNTFFLFTLGIIMGSVGGILTKLGANTMGAIEISGLSSLMDFAVKIITNWKIVLGLALYFLSAVVWTYLLTKLELSYVQPILALTYVVTPILAMIFIGEKVPIARWIGIIIIIFGVYIVSRTSS